MDGATISQILAPVGAEETRDRETRVRDRFWRTAKRAARQIPFMDEVVAAYYAALDHDTPRSAKATLLAALAYFVVPLDVVPDFLAVVGFGDDLAVLTAVLTTLGPNIKERHRRAARQVLAED
jgi:uncharacterized membrane protein YkvA (DUF1232 family)